MFAVGPVCACSNLFGCHCFCLQRLEEEEGVDCVRVMHHFLPFVFVLLFIDRLIVTLDMSVVMEDRGTKTQVAAPRRRLTSQTGELIKHDQYRPPLPLHLFIYSFVLPGIYTFA